MIYRSIIKSETPILININPHDNKSLKN